METYPQNQDVAQIRQTQDPNVIFALDLPEQGATFVRVVYGS
jgi:hypothetical protein